MPNLDPKKRVASPPWSAWPSAPPSAPSECLSSFALDRDRSHASRVVDRSRDSSGKREGERWRRSRGVDKEGTSTTTMTAARKKKPAAARRPREKDSNSFFLALFSPRFFSSSLPLPAALPVSHFYALISHTINQTRNAQINNNKKTKKRQNRSSPLPLSTSRGSSPRWRLPPGPTTSPSTPPRASPWASLPLRSRTTRWPRALCPPVPRSPPTPALGTACWASGGRTSAPRCRWRRRSKGRRSAARRWWPRRGGSWTRTASSTLGSTAR